MRANVEYQKEGKEAAALVERVAQVRSTIYDNYESESTIYDERIIRK